MGPKNVFHMLYCLRQTTPHALSIGKAAPLIDLARSLAKNRIVLAISKVVILALALCNAWTGLKMSILAPTFTIGRNALLLLV